MILPVEIIERILLKCDGKSLLNARSASDFLKNTVDYLAKKTKLWQWCCNEDIPPEELAEYLLQYDNNKKIKNDDKWLQIYLNWYSWENIDKIDLFDPILRYDTPQICSMAVSANHIALGFSNGMLRLYKRNWKWVTETRIVAVKITEINFIGDDDYIDDSKTMNGCMVLGFPKGICIVIYDGLRTLQQDILDVKSHSIYNNYICMERVGGRVSVHRIHKINNTIQMVDIWFTRIYSPLSITCYHMWNGKCTFLINDNVFTLDYLKPDLTPMEELKKSSSRRIKFNSPLMIDKSTTRILRDNVILCIYKNTRLCSDDNAIVDYFEIIILDYNQKYSRKLFNMWEIFRSNITCVFLYGNTLLIGTANSDLYFYHVSNWKVFDLKLYDHKQVIGRHPITSISVKEDKTGRKYYICSKFTVHEVTGFVPNLYN